MANQETNDRKDRTGGDLTRASELNVEVEKTKWDILNSTGSNSIGDK